MTDVSRQSPTLLGWLFLSGAVWVTVALATPAVWQAASRRELILVALAAAYVVGVGLLVRRRRELPVRVAWTLVVFGTGCVTVLVSLGPPELAGASGGLFGYVAAYSFLFFDRRAAAVQWALATLGFGFALLVNPTIPFARVQWLLVSGIAVGGAGIVGAVGARVREQAAEQREAAARDAGIAMIRSTFLQAVSHELRTPLTALVGFAATLDDHGDDLDPTIVRQLHARMRGQSERLSLLLDDLLDLDRLRRGDAETRREPADLRAIVANALRHVTHTTHDVRVWPLPAEPVDVEAALVERVVVNLVANATRHTPPGTRVDITAALDGDQLVLEVADDGLGIPNELLLSLFEPFVQGPDAPDRANPGTGIGLSLVRQMARMHGGDVAVATRPAGGAVFRVVFADVLPRDSDELREQLASDLELVLGSGPGRDREARTGG